MPSPDWPEKQVKQSTGLQKFFNKTSAKPPPPWKSKTNIANGKGRRASDDVTDRSEHTPRVVAVELKEPKARVWDRGVKNCKNIAKPLVSLQQIIRTSTPRSASPKKKSEKPQQDNSKGENGNLLATVIAVNGDENVVWREVKPNSTSQHASGNKVTVNISSVSPPPVPPLPASLLPPVPPRPTPNLFCLHPKIKLKTLQSAPLSSRPSRIPKLCPNPSGLRSVDCLVSLYEGSNAARRHKIAAIDQEKTTRINSQKLKEEFEEVLKKYEALERECQNLNTSRGSSPESLEPRSAPCSLLHIEDPTANVTRTNSEADLLKPRLTKIIPCNRIRNTKSETEICKSPSAYGIGIVRANTGRRVSESRYRTELEIFFRSGVLAQLEAQRDEKLTDNVVRLQARCRGYLARRKLNKLKIQDLAVRCIQRNVRKFMSVRDWPWWRLLVRVTPLLNVHRTEEELKIKTEELEQLRAKVEKLEQERNHLKHDNDRLEAKLYKQELIYLGEAVCWQDACYSLAVSWARWSVSQCKPHGRGGMFPGSSRFGAGIVDMPPPVQLPQGQTTAQITTQPGDSQTVVFSGLFKKSMGVTKEPNRIRVMSPTSVSPTRDVQSSRSIFSPTREASSSRSIFSPTREPSASRSIFSPTRELSPRSKVMFPTRERVTSPVRDYSATRLMSPTRDFSTSRVMSPAREYTTSRLMSPTRDFSASRGYSASRLMSPTREYSTPRLLVTSNDHLNTRLMSPSRFNSSVSSYSSNRLLTPGRDYSSSRLLSPSRYTRSPSVSSYAHSRSPSPISQSSRSCSLTTSDFPRRVFPQTSTRLSLKEELKGKEDSPVVFDAGLSFVMGVKNQPIRQQFKPRAAHLQPATVSSTLTSKIKDFLRRTDHIMEEWKRMGKKDPDENGGDGYSSRSATNILIKGFQMFSKADKAILSPNMSCVSEEDPGTASEMDELSEMTADLAEEHSTSTLATERLEAETADRLRLEKELQETQSENKNLQQTTERLEMELLYMRAADVNGGVMSDEDEEGEGDLGVYKQRYERTVRELEFTKRRLQQQHEDDLEQLVGLKKQLEKKLADAFEEVEEQRQIVAQWKRKVAKLNAETNDLRLLLEEQNSRNHLLEKKQRKFDSELQLLQDELRQEKQAKERISREKELVLAEKYSTEQNLSAIRLELELKEEKIVSLTQELDELTFGGKTEEEVAHLKKTKHELDKKLKEQEEELDDLAGQVQLLEQAKLRLEMSLEQQRKEHRRELSQRDEELEDARCNAQKKVKALEAQLENEHEERTLLLREKHELERRLGALEEAGRATRATDEDQLHRLRKDLRRTKALLRDAQTQLERSKGDSPGKAILRQLRNQVEDLECARAAAVKARQSAEMELAEVQAQLEEAQRVKSDAEERAAAALRERSDIRSQLEENEEELAEVMKKYRAAVQQLSVDQMALQEQAGQVAELESERASLKEQLAELTTRLESIETVGDTTSTLAQRRLEMRIKELESRLELEQTTRSRMEVQISRLKETVEKLQTEAATARAKEQTAQDAARKLQRTVRELREESTVAQAREAEAAQRRKDLEKRLEAAEAEAAAARGDLRLALTRIQDLQSAIQGELEDCSGSEHSDSEQDSDGSDDSISTFLANHKMPTTRSSLELDITQRSSPMDSPTKVCSNINSESKESFA